MSKERKTFSLDPDAAEYLSDDSVNASGLVNQLVQKHMSGGGGGAEQMIKLRIEQVEDDKQSLIEDKEAIEKKIERKERELEGLNERLDEYSTDVEAVVKEAAQKLRLDVLDADNVAVQNFAEKASVPPHEFVEMVRDEMEGGE